MGSSYIVKHSLSASVLLALMLTVGHPASAQKKELFRDTTDNAFDISPWLMQKEGFLPIPSVITEPAVGFGGAAALLFFHSSYLKKKGPPNISGVAGGGTQNGTWGVGVFHAGFYKNDRIRYTGALFKLNVNLKFYGPGLIFKDGIGLNLNSWLLFQQLKFRIGASNFFIGGQYLLLNTKNTFDKIIDLPPFNGTTLNANLSELTAVFNYESRNNVFTPTKGIFAQITATYSDDWLGGEGLYGRLNGSIIGFIPLNKFNLGLRWESIHSLGDVPFWARPIVMMRGVPAMKYQNKNVSLVEAEINYNLYRRWYLLIFSGLGNTYTDFSSFSEGSPVATVGTGFRYQIARLFGLKMGADVAWSTEDFAFYVTVGHAWLR